MSTARASSLRLAAFAAILLSVTPAVAQDLSAARRPTLTASGEGIVTATPDMATFSTGVVSSAKTAREALDANSKSVSDMIAAIKAVGIEAKDIATSNFSVRPVYAQRKDGEDQSRIVAYEVRNTVSVRVRELGKLAGLLDEVVSRGANQIGGISFGLAEPAKLEEQARVAAVRDARRQAELMAEAGGVRLTRVLAIAEDGASPPMPRAMPAPMMMKAAEAVPVEAGESEARARVTITFEIEPR
ncbi:SIMPL domain-containing protein [Bosea sp. 117]|uniref:SIMPL domain-containing protein n=1 Tax=Bosea sp. 117 TaxID=1125973 RepID=UPI0004946468|nr:SIMPL domain-containing protein [Bosea sp. 117]